MEIYLPNLIRKSPCVLKFQSKNYYILISRKLVWKFLYYDEKCKEQIIPISHIPDLTEQLQNFPANFNESHQNYEAKKLRLPP